MTRTSSIGIGGRRAALQHQKHETYDSNTNRFCPFCYHPTRQAKLISTPKAGFATLPSASFLLRLAFRFYVVKSSLH